MKKQFYLLMALVVFASTSVMAQLPSEIVFPGGSIGPIESYADMDGEYGNLENDAEGLVQAVFCYDSEIELDAVEVGTGDTYASYQWYLIEEGEESSAPIHIGNGAEGQRFQYDHIRTGYHRFRVYGYNDEDQGGCFEITDVAVYVFPPISISEDYTPESDEFCENEDAKLEQYNSTDQGVILNVEDLDIDITEGFNGDLFTLNYEWYIIKDGVRSTLTKGESTTYRIGSEDDDLDFTLGNIALGDYEYGVRAYYIFEETEICETDDIKMYDLTITEAPAKPVIRINGAVNSRQQVD